MTPDTAARKAPHPLTPSGLLFTLRLVRLTWREFRRRWPAIVGVLRDGTVVYRATVGPPERAMLTIDRPHSVVMDSTFVGSTGAAVGVENA